MNLKTKYIYRLGHQPEFGANEFYAITKIKPEYYNRNYLFSNYSLPINQTGALVFRAEIISIASRENLTFKKFFTESLKQAFTQNPTKKIGISLPNSELNEQQIILLAKTIGYKKINLLAPTKEPNIGNLMKTSNWLVALEAENNWILAQIEDYSNQEFWSLLDQQLPITDMKRGVINLKLARTLMNFTDNTKIWDPFCGVGRNLISGIDLKTDFIASDLSPECLPEATKNYNFSCDFYSGDVSKAKLKDIFQADVENLERDTTGLFNGFAVSTEGFLGQNFTSTPTIGQQRTELAKITKLWQLALKNFQDLKITEIVACLPFYQYDNSKITVDLPSLLIGNKYKYHIFLNGEKSLYYRRYSSFVGHQVVKFSLVLD